MERPDAPRKGPGRLGRLARDHKIFSGFAGSLLVEAIAVIAALARAGFEPGDDVRIGEHEFELHI